VGPEARSRRAQVTRRGIVLPARCNDVVDVLFDDVRVFSAAVDQGRVTADGRRLVEWPRALRPYLRGSTTAVLRAHVGGDVLCRKDLTFTKDSTRVRVVDDSGLPLALDKWGALQRTFAAGNPDKAAMLEATSDLVEVLNTVVEVPTFIAYGTLLGAVRGGRLIGHDNDVDVAYYSRFQHPADIMRESFAIERQLNRLGWETTRRTGAFLQARRPSGGQSGPKVDLFAAYHCNGWFALHKWVRGRLPQEAILPLGEIELEGMTFPAPHDPESLLAVTYGEGWRIPDPSFSFAYPRATRVRAEGWFGGWRREKGGWRGAARRGGKGGEVPSPFARHVDKRLSRDTTLVDVGCGTGRDSVWLAREGRQVIGLDYVSTALTRARKRAQRSEAPARFEALNLYELRHVLASGARLALTEPDVAVYARYVLNALWPDGRANLWLLAKTLLGGGGSLYVEFLTRVGPDGSLQHVPPPLLGGLDPEAIVAELVARGGRVLSRDERDEDGRRFCRLEVAFAR
jgi:SAM-dependent methyltransferase